MPWPIDFQCRSESRKSKIHQMYIGIYGFLACVIHNARWDGQGRRENRPIRSSDSTDASQKLRICASFWSQDLVARQVVRTASLGADLGSLRSHFMFSGDPGNISALPEENVTIKLVFCISQTVFVSQGRALLPVR